ncbi:transcriptional regulator NrdR [Georgenia sp. SYP-B2076]|uniref:transcriptional regulator NrdR n=1 Tax=Georgenia sp. SYP-B2076 TaxID=2495881 RepID=UPI000F8E1714|nr:transcriptional regulator NrdR [Georgenia sp. SYP-B2076]
MHCPFCRHADSRVIDSRTAEDGATIRRRRQCPACGRRFTTLETSSLSVLKRSGATEPFSRDKVVSGVRKACQGRPVSDDDLALLAQQVEETVRSSGAAQIDAHEIGLAILGPLRQLDEIAYLRFASVYSSFSTLEDFEVAIAALRAENAEREGAAAQAAESAAGLPAAGGNRSVGSENLGDQNGNPTGAGSASLVSAVGPDRAPAH